jgi:hypothetical protein
MKYDTTLWLNFKIFLSISIFTTCIVLYHILSNDHPGFMIRHHTHFFYGIEYFILNKIYYDVTIILFYISILIDFFMTYFMFKEFSDLSKGKKRYNRIYSRKILFILSSICFTTTIWAFCFFDNYNPILAFTFSTITVGLVIWKIWLTKKARLGNVILISVPIFITGMLNWVLTIEAILSNDEF